MIEAAGSAQIDDLVKLFKESFPDVHCLRCGHDGFYILPAIQQAFLVADPAISTTLLPVITLACTRCGHIEQHLSQALRGARKPIEIEKTAAP